MTTLRDVSLPAWLANDPLPPAILAVGHSPAEARRVARSLFFARACAEKCNGGETGCGKCPACRSLACGAHPDWVEVGAEEREVEELRLLLGRLALAPTGPFRLVFLPGVEGLSPAGAAALLKVMEDPPSLTTFFLQAENPLRVLPTIRSRSFRFSLPDPVEAEEAALAEPLAKYARGEGDWAGVSAALGRATGGEAREKLLASVRPARARTGGDPQALLGLARFAEALTRNVAPKLAKHLLGHAR